MQNRIVGPERDLGGKGEWENKWIEEEKVRYREGTGWSKAGEFDGFLRLHRGVLIFFKCVCYNAEDQSMMWSLQKELNELRKYSRMSGVQAG